MENISDIMESDDLELAEIDDHLTSFESKTLLDMPVEVIEMIISQLNLEDKKNLGLTNKKLNHILSDCPNLWKDVRLKFYDRKTLKASELTRKYVNVECDQKSFKKLADEGAWAHLAANLKSLYVRQSADLSLKCLVTALPFFENLVHWDFWEVYSYSLKDDFDQSIVSDQILRPVEMKNLKYLKMNTSVVPKLHDRFVNFSTSSLKTLSLCTTRDYQRDNHVLEDEKVIVTFVKRQNDLEILKLNLVYAWIFDKPLTSDVQLREIDLTFRIRLETQEQNNMLDFLDSQKRLERQSIVCKGKKTDRMLNYHKNLLDSAVTEQFITFYDVEKEPERISWSVGSEGLIIALYSREFTVYYEHPENLNTAKLRVIIKISTVPEVQALITGICEKFPNLKDLKIELADKINLENNDYVSITSINLSNLRSLEKLESLELKYDTIDSSSYRLLENVTIENLKKFVYFPHFPDFKIGELEMDDIQHLLNLKNFMSRHVNLNYLKFEIIYDPSTMTDANLTEIFGDFGFDMEKKFKRRFCIKRLEITLTRRENEN